MFVIHTGQGKSPASSFLSRTCKAAAGFAMVTLLAVSLGAVPASAAPNPDIQETTAPRTAVTGTPEPSQVTAAPTVAPLAPATAAATPTAVTGPEPGQDLAPSTSGPGAHMGQGAARKAQEVAAAGPGAMRRFAGESLAAPVGVYGMDVSGWQADPVSYSVTQVDWNRQWALGSRFVYAKATEGASFVDASRASHLAGAGGTGMLQGAYHFALPGQGTAASQADFFVNNGGFWRADGKTMPPLLDIEYNPYSTLGNTCYNYSPTAMVQWIKDFSERIKARTGRLPMIYTTTDWWSRCTGNSAAFTAQPLHIAGYSSTLGALPNGWDFHSIWQYSDNGPFAGDSNIWNGSLGDLKTFAGLLTPPPAPKPSIRSAGDVVAADAAGLLWDYPATGKGALGARTQIGHGWRGLRSITVTDWNADGVFDLVAQWQNGKVTTYLGIASGGFSTGPVLAASGWAGNQLTIGPWLEGSKYPQIISRASNGTLSLWSNPSGAGLGTARTIGTGWGKLDLVMVDFDGNGTQDLLARNSSGALLLYRSNGQGNFLSQARPTVGTGWDGMTSLSVATGFTAGNSVGIVARTSRGGLLYYPTPGNTSFGTRSTIGNSWTPMLIAGGENLSARKGI